MKQHPVYVFARWQVKEGRLDTVLKTLAAAVAESRKEPGNLFYRVCQSQADPNVLLLSEGYVDDAALEAHRGSAHFQTLVIGTIIPELAQREVQVTSELFPDQGERG